MEGLALNTLFGGVYSGRSVLVTGHTGFKGSWLCLWLSQLGADVTGLALDPSTQPSHWSLLRLNAVRDVRMNLLAFDELRQAVQRAQPEIVFHLAAQSLVRRSYSEPRMTFETNVLGFTNLLEAVRATGSVRALINVTTDKVYAEPPVDSGYCEEHPLGGHDPYSASKACSELVTDCYRKSFFANSGPRVATVRAGNVIGGGDWAEDRLIPDIVRAMSAGSPARIRNPNAERPWQHVLEPLSGYLLLGQKLLEGGEDEGPWNFGPPAASLPVHTVIAMFQAQWPDLRYVQDSGAHPREAPTLRLDSSKAAARLAWHPLWSCEEAIGRTAKWYRAFHERQEVRSSIDLADYVSAAHTRAEKWAA